MWEEVDSFEAVDDDDKQYTIVVYQKRSTVRTMDGLEPVKGGPTRLALLNGAHVNDNEDGTYEIFDSGVRLRKL